MINLGSRDRPEGSCSAASSKTSSAAPLKHSQHLQFARAEGKSHSYSTTLPTVQLVDIRINWQLNSTVQYRKCTVWWTRENKNKRIGSGARAHRRHERRCEISMLCCRCELRVSHVRSSAHLHAFISVHSRAIAQISFSKDRFRSIQIDLDTNH